MIQRPRVAVVSVDLLILLNMGSCSGFTSDGATVHFFQLVVLSCLLHYYEYLLPILYGVLLNCPAVVGEIQYEGSRGHQGKILVLEVSGRKKKREGPR